MAQTDEARGLRRLLAVVDPGEHDGPGEFLPDTVLTAIAELIRCDHVLFQAMDPSRCWATAQGYHSGSEPPDADAEIPLFWEGFWDSPACSLPQRTGDYATVTRLSDHTTRKELSRSAIGSYFAAVGIRHELMVPLPPDGRIDRRLLLFRDDGTDFTENDVLVMTLLRPHLIALHARQRSRMHVPELTARQRQIVAMVAAGCTNAQIARSLHVSEGTVRKHLENTFQRLDVNSRTAAASRVSRW